MAIILFRTDGRTDGRRTDGRSDRDYKAKPGQLGWARAGPELGKTINGLLLLVIEKELGHTVMKI